MEWISTKEKTPEDFKPLLFTTGEEVLQGYRVSSSYFDDDNEIYYCSNETFYSDVTHWMPLPELPKD